MQNEVNNIKPNEVLADNRKKLIERGFLPTETTCCTSSNGEFTTIERWEKPNEVSYLILVEFKQNGVIKKVVQI